MNKRLKNSGAIRKTIMANAIVFSTICVFSGTILSGCASSQTKTNTTRDNSLQRNWNANQRELYQQYRPKVVFEVCNRPDYNDKSYDGISGTNFVLNLPNGEIIEMI